MSRSIRSRHSPAWLLLGLCAAWGICGGVLWFRPQVSTALVRVASQEQSPVKELLTSREFLDAIPTDLASSTQFLPTDFTAHYEGDQRWVIRRHSLVRETAVPELTALTDALIQELRQRRDVTLRAKTLAPDSAIAQAEQEFQRQTLHEQITTLTTELSELNAGGADPEVRQQHLRELDQRRLSARETLQNWQAEWDVLQAGLDAGTGLETLMARLSPGVVQQTAREILRQQQLRRELAQLESQWEAESGVYGARHPRRIRMAEQLAQIQQALDTTILDESPAETLSRNLSPVLARQEALLADLDLQSRMERDDQTAVRSVEEQLAQAQTALQKLGPAPQSVPSTTGVIPSTAAIRVVDAPWLDQARWPVETWPLLAGSTLAGLAGGWLLGVLLQRRYVAPELPPKRIPSLAGLERISPTRTAPVEDKRTAPAPVAARQEVAPKTAASTSTTRAAEPQVTAKATTHESFVAGNNTLTAGLGTSVSVASSKLSPAAKQLIRERMRQALDVRS